MYFKQHKNIMEIIVLYHIQNDTKCLKCLHCKVLLEDKRVN